MNFLIYALAMLGRALFGRWEEPTYCEECDKVIEPNRDMDLCDECWNTLYCECGQRLEDAWGSPGDGFCIKCR